MIAYNSISCIKNIIELLKQEGGDEISGKIAVLCGMYGRKEVGEYYIELKGNRLPKQITFITSAYFVGVDIDGRLSPYFCCQYSKNTITIIN